ncbi:putative exopolyphosphatase [Paraburkholderia xenovorans LB400]|uniref:Acetyl-CoA acetyltransferase n=1 Tax=Paraburkholderia xenovorans (strain LB400) TaxID=266265 RepID=Q13HM7_PARXL|nr:lipid-transfer protein [Paraburkholderia xenovorans]ABE36412.1 Putative acetyl-CoA acetyltransferase [Paraburkholderia xenovorans LB400]AIP34647.1 putative exopolyphosphatase [Paraburkholderia xenovorans LB400]
MDISQAAIAGIGATAFTKKSGVSEWRLAVEAVKAALDDAGIAPTEVDGLVTYSMDTNPEVYIAQALGMKDLTFFSRIHYGGGAACATIQQAALAVTSGVAKVVVCYRAFNERSGLRLGSGVMAETQAVTTESLRYGWVAPYGLKTPASWVALFAQRYMHVYGATSESFGHVAVSSRKYAATNPKAHFYGRPITLEDHQQSRWISHPLRLLDCCQETDGGQALVVTTLDHARTLRHKPARIVASAQGSAPQQHPMTSFYRDDLTGLAEMGVVARQLWAQSKLKPSDIDAAIIYDHFTPLVLMQLEELGFCERGEAKDFVKGHTFDLTGELPMNMNGGQLGEAYLHGMNGIAEAVRQIRGNAVNQVSDVNHVLVTAGTGPPTSGLILAAEH